MKVFALCSSVLLLLVSLWLVYKFLFKPYFWPVKKKHMTFERRHITFEDPAKELMYKWNLAKDMGDSVEMCRLLREYRKNCPHANSYCLSEVYCPECPYCELDVRSVVKNVQV